MGKRDAFIRQQARGAALVNAVLNPLLAWLGHRDRAVVPLADVVVDLAVTSLVLSLLVAVFVGRSARRARLTGELPSSDRAHRGSAAPGLAIGLVAALACALVLTLAGRAGLEGLPFIAFAAFKGAYAAGLAFLVAKRVLRRLT